MGSRIAMVSTRLAGTDGVSLEASKWFQVLDRNGHECCWFAGELEREPDSSMQVPEAHFQDQRNRELNGRMFGRLRRDPADTEAIHRLRANLKGHLHAFIRRFRPHALIVENALTIPMHIPLGLAITETLAETGLPAIAHHHDFYWERKRFAVNAVGDLLAMAFPPRLPNIEHVVINSAAREQLALRTGLSSVVIPNVLDFDTPPRIDGGRSRRLRARLGLAPDEVLVLQPTRIVRRKGIEHAVELVRKLELPRCRLLISHEAGDEGFEYADWLEGYARERGVRLTVLPVAAGDPFNDTAGDTPSLWDVYALADLVTFPSTCEGFGNAFLEALYFRRPLVINRYETFVRDIEPNGFDLIVMDGYVTQATVDAVRQVLDSPLRRRRMVDHNYQVAGDLYSYRQLWRELSGLLGRMLPEAAPGSHQGASADRWSTDLRFKTPINRLAV